jgi:ankyrin repeat protein
MLRGWLLRQDADGMTPLHYAATCENVEVVSALLAAGANLGVHARATPLCSAQRRC